MNTSRNQWTIGLKLWILSACLILNLLVMGIVSQWNNASLTESLNDIVDVQLPAVRTMTLADMMHDGIRANAFHAVIVSGSKDRKELTEVEEESQEFAKNIDAYLTTLSTLKLPTSTTDKLGPARAKIKAYVEGARQIVTEALAGDLDHAMTLLPAFQEQFSVLETDLGALGEAIEGDAKVSSDSAHHAAARATMIGWIVMGIGLLLGLTFAAIIIRSLKLSLTQAVDHLGQESNHVVGIAASLSASASNLSDSTNQQSGALQETAAAVDEITAMARKTAENSSDLEKSAQLSQGAAARGQGAITEMLGAINLISESNTKVMQQVEIGNQQIAEIVQVIGEIGNKTKIINDIVFQTKLLSFNASVEAARAGEHGKGFAVVSEEIGNLAQMSGNASKEISDLLAASVQKVALIVSENKRKVQSLINDGVGRLENGKRVARLCQESLEEIVNQSGGVSSMVGEISRAMREQNDGIHEISKSLDLLDDSSHKNAATSQETLSFSDQLHKKSQSLNEVVDMLRRLTTGANEMQ